MTASLLGTASTPARSSPNWNTPYGRISLDVHSATSNNSFHDSATAYNAGMPVLFVFLFFFSSDVCVYRFAARSHPRPPTHRFRCERVSPTQLDVLQPPVPPCGPGGRQRCDRKSVLRQRRRRRSCKPWQIGSRSHATVGPLVATQLTTLRPRYAIRPFRAPSLVNVFFFVCCLGRLQRQHRTVTARRSFHRLPCGVVRSGRVGRAALRLW